MKRFSTVLALALGAFVSISSADQIQGFVTGFIPGDVQVVKTENGADSYSNLHSDFAWSLGVEYLKFPTGPLMVGGGVGFVSVQKDGGDNVVMPAIPLWASIGAIGPEAWVVRPYFEARVGYAFPAAKFATWWGRPLNFLVAANIGAQLPYNMGVELNVSYLSMDKNFKAENVNYRLNSLKFGGSITVRFDLSKSSAESNKASSEKVDVYVQPAAEDFSNGSSSDVNGESESTNSYEQSYSDYGEQSAEESTSETAEESAADESSDVESSDEETAEAAEETPVEEAAAEAPAEEPKAEPAPAPEKKAAAKKAPAKKKAAKKKAPAKKKAAKKPAKKAPAKKKK